MASVAKMARTGKVIDRKIAKVGTVQENPLAADRARFEFFGSPVYSDTKERTNTPGRRIAAGPTVEEAVRNAGLKGWVLE